MKRPRLAIVVSHPIQYYAPWFRHLAAEPDLAPRVFYLSDHGVAARADAQFGAAFAWDTDLLSGYEHRFIPNTARRPDVTRFDGLKNPGLRPALREFAPDAVLLFGYAYRPHLGLLLRPPAPILFRGDSHLLGQRRGPSAPGPRSLDNGHWSSIIRHRARSLARSVALRFVYSRCAAFLPVGSANADYFRHHGVPAEKLFPAPHCVDAAHFVATPERLAEASALRASLGIPATARVVLFAGKLIPKKRPDLLLAAFVRVAPPGAHLVFSGDGELLPALRAATEAGGRSDVHFLPFANQSAMPARYLLGDVFVLPSEGRHETWGLAVNEAMHLGRPCLVSDHVGCHPDLVRPGVTGWVFPAGDESALADGLREVLARPRDELAAVGRAARRHVSDFNYAAATNGLRRALAHVLRRR